MKGHLGHCLCVCEGSRSTVVLAQPGEHVGGLLSWGLGPCIFDQRLGERVRPGGKVRHSLLVLKEKCWGVPCCGCILLQNQTRQGPPAGPLVALTFPLNEGNGRHSPPGLHRGTSARPAPGRDPL